jgi:catechol 2,3-dioxygenase-like lactoylglutathione lyase family enzyme
MTVRFQFDTIRTQPRGNNAIMSRISPARFVHVVYRTRRFEQMVQWYETVFDAKVRYQNPVLAFLTYDDEHHRIALLNLAVVQPDATETERRGAVGVDHVAYTYASLNDLFENYAQLKEKSIRPYWCIHHGVTVSMYYADPDGNQMELQVDACATAEEADAYMHGPHFATNPIGVEYDPDEILAQLRAGTPESEILTRKTDLPVSPVRGAIAA